MKTTITFDIDTDRLPHITDSYLVQLWHIAQANPADIASRQAGELVEHIGREIIRRFVSNTPPELWSHQGSHYYSITLGNHGRWVAGVWVPDQQTAANSSEGTSHAAG